MEKEMIRGIVPSSSQSWTDNINGQMLYTRPAMWTMHTASWPCEWFTVPLYTRLASHGSHVLHTATSRLVKNKFSLPLVILKRTLTLTLTLSLNLIMWTAVTATDCAITVNRKYSRSIEYIFNLVLSYGTFTRSAVWTDTFILILPHGLDSRRRPWPVEKEVYSGANPWPKDCQMTRQFKMFTDAGWLFCRTCHVTQADKQSSKYMQFLPLQPVKTSIVRMHQVDNVYTCKNTFNNQHDTAVAANISRHQCMFAPLVSGRDVTQHRPWLIQYLAMHECSITEGPGHHWQPHHNNTTVSSYCSQKRLCFQDTHVPAITTAVTQAQWKLHHQ